ncbi:MAG TPA: AtpZ/AtpI family protein [Candidatus Saccharimonadales bacterium]|nr:AtpZ/AtpI family protein [Candidatus Saccharimonadales bacterium]
MKNVASTGTDEAFPKSELKSKNKQDMLKKQFLATVVSMSWQLAIVVLLPVLGGYSLDKHSHTQPLWTIVGFAGAVVGVVAILRRTLKIVSDWGET